MKINGMKKAIAMAGAVGAMMCPMLANAAESPVPTVEGLEEGGVISDVKTEDGKVVSFEFTEEVADGYIDIDLDNDGEAEQIYVHDGKYDAQVTATANFVAGYYSVALDRPYEQAGLQTWVNELVDNGQGAADIAHGFFASDEFINNAKGEDGVLDDAEIDAVIEKFYLTMLGRAADETGKATWSACLRAGMTVDALVQGLAYSDEFAEKCGRYGVTPGTYQPTAAVDQNYERTAFASRLYTVALDRPYDQPGLEDWCSQLTAGKSGAEVAYGFVFSQEMNDKNDGEGLSDAEFIDMLYRTLFGREADPEGRQNWINALTVYSREEVFDLFTDSVEFGNLCDKAGIAAK